MRSQRGLTLIEIAIALLLLGILSTLAVPAFQHWIQNTNIRNGAEAIQNGMQLARAEAVRRNMPVQLVLGTGSSWVVSVPSTAVEIQRYENVEGSKTAVVAIVPSGADRITFNGMGWLATNNDGSDSITQINVSGAALSDSEIRTLRIVVSTGGASRMCDPNVTTGDPRAC